MKKLILPILCGIFTLFFSGKPASNQYCGPILFFGNFIWYEDDIPIPVARIDVYNAFTGTTTIFNNPTFPFTHRETGGRITVTYTFSGGTYNCAVLVHSPCYAVNSKGVTGTAITFPITTCNHYSVDLISAGPGDSHGCR